MVLTDMVKYNSKRVSSLFFSLVASRKFEHRSRFTEISSPVRGEYEHRAGPGDGALQHVRTSHIRNPLTPLEL